MPPTKPRDDVNGMPPVFARAGFVGALGMTIVGMAFAIPSAASEPSDPAAMPVVLKQAQAIYPEHSRRLDEEGDTLVSFGIDRAGSVTGCETAMSSGFGRLDEASCDAIAKMRFVPRSDGEAATRGPFILSMKWRLGPDYETLQPEPRSLDDPSRGINRTLAGELRPGERVNLGLYLRVSDDGTVVGCKVRWGSGRADLDARACDIARSWRYAPAANAKSGRSRQRLETFFYADPSATIPSS